MSWIDDVRAKVGRFVTVEKLPAGGSLQARADRAGGIALYFRAKRDGLEVRENIGLFDASVPPRSVAQSASGGWSLLGAKTRAGQLAAQHQQTRGGLGQVRREQAAQQRVMREERDALKSHTVAALFAAYVELLEQRGKVDVGDVRSTLRRFLARNPDLATLPARDATPQHFVRGLRVLAEEGKTREPGKVRSYAHAAFRTALLSISDPSIPLRFEAFRITNNPLAAVATTPAQPDKNPLHVDELRAFWHIACETPGERGALMRLHLLLGGQRIAQLLRLRRDDVHPDHIVLLDPKGKRTTARLHVVPLLPRAKIDLDTFTGAPYVFSKDGTAPYNPETFSAWETEAVGGAIAQFQPKRVRSGVETALARLGISLEVRAQLQSHGLGGIQARHYDAHDYLEEKRAALAALDHLVSGESAS